MPPPVGCAELHGRTGTLLAHGQRSDDREITVYKAMGHVAEDAAGASLAYAAALEAGLGVEVEL
jgi:ornithine cyclodeaminase